MSTNTVPPVAGWPDLRDQLLELIENRRAIASTFKYSEVYFFMSRCMTAFNSPGTDKGQSALNAIADNGSFRLVADSLRDFLAMFPATGQPADKGDQLEPGHQPGPTHSISARPGPGRPF